MPVSHLSEVYHSPLVTSRRPKNLSIPTSSSPSYSFPSFESVQFSYLHRPFSASVKGPQMTFTRFMPGTHFAFGGHVSQSSSEENTYPGFVFVWPIHFEDHRPFIFLTIRFRSCIFGRNVKGPGFGLLRAQMRRLCSQ